MENTADQYLYSNAGGEFWKKVATSPYINPIGFLVQKQKDKKAAQAAEMQEAQDYAAQTSGGGSGGGFGGGSSTLLWVGVGVTGLLVIGGIIYFVTRKKK